MDRLKKIIACMREFGIKPKVESFESKLVIQKATCLLGLLGFNSGYRFSIYVRGPYSPDLTRDIYENRDDVEKLRTDYSLSGIEKGIVAKVSEASDNLDPTLLEIMATYAFLSREYGLSGKAAIAELKRLKPFFSESRIAVGVSRAKELFPPSENDIKEMKKEFAEWENAALSDNKY
jgi:uncharacterized protein YwgA